MEIWKDIKGYEGLYQISNFGNVKSLQRKGVQNDRLLTPEISYKGYTRVALMKDKKRQFHSIHRLVAEAFLDKKNFKSLPQEDRENIDLFTLEVNHIDEFDKLNNKIDNLEWCTPLYNTKFGTKIERCAQKHRKRVRQYDINNNYIRTFDGVRVASRITGIDNGGISKCCLKLRSQAGGYIWRYENE